MSTAMMRSRGKGESTGSFSIGRFLKLDGSRGPSRLGRLRKGVCNMERTIGIPGRLAGMIIGLALLVVGLGFLVLGVSFLPVIGILLAIPILGIAWHFVNPKTIAHERIADFLVRSDVMYHPGHAWARMEGNDIVTVGMDDFAVKLLGSVDLISLPKEGSRVKQGSFGWLMKAESRAIHMLSPVEGEVVAVNREIIDSPALAFEDPYGKGWLFKVRNANIIPNMKNMVPASMVREWFENIRETLAGRQPAPAAAGLCQDGGELVSGLARAIDPQGWDDLAREYFLTK